MLGGCAGFLVSIVDAPERRAHFDLAPVQPVVLPVSVLVVCTDPVVKARISWGQVISVMPETTLPAVVPSYHEHYCSYKDQIIGELKIELR